MSWLKRRDVHHDSPNEQEARKYQWSSDFFVCVLNMHMLHHLIDRLCLHTLPKAHQQDVCRIHTDMWLIHQTFEKAKGIKDVPEQRAIANQNAPATFGLSDQSMHNASCEP